MKGNTANSFSKAVRWTAIVSSFVLCSYLVCVEVVTSEVSEGPAVRIAQFAGDRAAAISYTFDDNLRDQYTLAVPMLNEVGFKGTFFVIAGRTAETPEAGEERSRAIKVRNLWGGISWPELKEMAGQGHEIASHTWSHRGLKGLPPEEVKTEFSKAYEEIKTRIGFPPLTVAFPYNQSTPEVQTEALRLHATFRAFQIGTSAKSTSASLNAWANKLVEERKWGVFMAHGIAVGYAALTDPEIFRVHLKHVKEREHEIWVDTFANISRYVREREDASLRVTRGDRQLSCVLSGSLDPKLFDVPLTIVVDVSGAAMATAKRDGLQLPVKIGKEHLQVSAVPGTSPIVITWESSLK